MKMGKFPVLEMIYEYKISQVITNRKNITNVSANISYISETKYILIVNFNSI